MFPVSNPSSTMTCEKATVLINNAKSENKLFVGSDYKGTERFNRYEEYFKDKGVEIVYFPYTQGTSSTQIRDAIISKSSENKK